MRNGHVGEEWEGNTSIKGKFVALTKGASQEPEKRGGGGGRTHKIGGR